MVEAVRLHWIFSVPVGIPISIFGLLGNILSMFVWTKILRRTYSSSQSTAIYLFILAIVDSGLLIFFILTDSLPKLIPSVQKSQVFCTFFSYIGFPFFFYFIVASIWIVVAVTINRFIAVVFPLRAKRFCSTSRTYIGITATLLCSFIINIPHFFNFRPQSTGGVYSSAKTDYSKRGSALQYEFWVHCMFLVLAPWAIVAFCNFGMIYVLLKRGKKLQGQNKKLCGGVAYERQMTMMLLGVTTSFLIFLAWQCITQCFYMLKYGNGTSDFDLVDKSYAAAKLGVVINSSINVLLYCCTGSAFRKQLCASLGGTEATFTTTSSWRRSLTVDSTGVQTENENVAE